MDTHTHHWPRDSPVDAPPHGCSIGSCGCGLWFVRLVLTRGHGLPVVRAVLVAVVAVTKAGVGAKVSMNVGGIVSFGAVTMVVLAGAVCAVVFL
jgi:hypothetical protein